MRGFGKLSVPNEEGDWEYSYPTSFDVFQLKFPEDVTTYTTFSQHVQRRVLLLRNSGSVITRKYFGKFTVLSEGVVEDIRQRMNVSP